MSKTTLPLTSLALSALLLAAAPAAQAGTPQELLASYVAKAGAPASAERGQKLFTTNFDKALGLTCTSCHRNPTGHGKDAVTDKPIKPLAPSANAARFTDAKKSDYQFDLNCRDVVGRLCTAGEKADVLAWLISLQ